MRFIPSEPQRLIDAHLAKHPDAYLCVGMGLGKSSAFLNRLDTMLITGESKGALVIAPLRVKNLTWPDEVAKFDDFRSMRIADLSTEQGKHAFKHGTAQLYTINYDRLRDLAGMVKANKGKVPYDTVVWDEVTQAKSNDSKRIALYQAWCPRVARHIGMTGTPVSNGYMDLWGQLRVIDNGERLGKSFDHYKSTHFEKKNQYAYKYTLREGAAEQIQARIADITLTLRAADWLNLPDIVLDDVPVDLPVNLMKQYRQLEKQMITEIAGQPITAVNAAALVTKLLQFTSGSLYDEDRTVHVAHGCKIRALEALLLKLKRPVLLAYLYQHEEARIRKAFPQAQFFCDATTEAKQHALKDRWNAGKVPVLACHPASVSHGLNLQDGGADVVWFTLPYSKEKYDQLNGRLYRRGQQEVVHVHRLMVPDSIDWAVAAALRAKEDEEAGLFSALAHLQALRANPKLLVLPS